MIFDEISESPKSSNTILKNTFDTEIVIKSMILVRTDPISSLKTHRMSRFGPSLKKIPFFSTKQISPPRLPAYVKKIRFGANSPGNVKRNELTTMVRVNGKPPGTDKWIELTQKVRVKACDRTTWHYFGITLVFRIVLALFRSMW